MQHLAAKRKMFLPTRKTNVFVGMKGRSKENMYMAKSERKEKKRNVPKEQKIAKLLRLTVVEK